MSRMLAIIATAGLTLCAALLSGAWMLGGDDVFHDPRSMEGLKPLIDLATRKEWRWAGGDTLALDAPMTLRYEPHATGEGGRPGVAVTGPAETVRHVRFSDGRIGADAPVPRGKSRLQAVVRGIPIRKFVVNGGEKLELGHVDQDELSLYVNGGGTVSGDGRVADLNLVMNGAGIANLGDLYVGDAKVSVLGPGEVTLSPHGDLRLFVAGNAHVVLKTRPESIRRTVWGNSIIETPDGVETVSPRPAPPPLPERPATPPLPERPAAPPPPPGALAVPVPVPAPMPMPMPSASSRDTVTVRDSSDRDLGHFDQERLTISVAGSGRVTAEGRVDELTVNIQHSGDARLGALSARKVTVHLMGSGSATISPSEEADISIMGAGNVTLMSKPPVIKRAILGSGRIIGAR